MVAIFRKANLPQNVDHLEEYLVHECPVIINYHHLLDSKPADLKMKYSITSYPSHISKESLGTVTLSPVVLMMLLLICVQGSVRENWI